LQHCFLQLINGTSCGRTDFPEKQPIDILSDILQIYYGVSNNRDSGSTGDFECMPSASIKREAGESGLRRNVTARAFVPALKDKQVMRPAPSTEEASKLCRSCGFCCSGVLHGFVKLASDEVDRIRHLGLATKRIKGKWAFTQPCPCLADTGCTIYAERPGMCRRYRCKLLKEFLDGKVDQDDASNILKKVWRAVRDLEEHLGRHDPKKSLWHCTEELALKGSLSMDSMEFRHAHAPLLLDLIALRVLCDRYFEKPAESPLPGSPERKSENGIS